MRIVRVSITRPGLKSRLLPGVILLLVCALVLLIVLLALSMVLIALPILVVGGLVYALLPRKRPASRPVRPQQPDVLEGHYRVVGNLDDNNLRQ